MVSNQSASAASAGDLTGLARFNGLPAEAARQALMACCSSRSWAEAVASGRPYESAARALRSSDEAVAGLTPGDLGEALSGHPRIGEGREGGTSREGGTGIEGGMNRWPRAEQAGLDGAADTIRRALAEGNAAYEQRFGHIYLVCASGRSAGELLDLLRARLGNDAETERGVLRSELKKINRIRLDKLLGGTT
jgi:2-oxo-4-hydroxy-4-carboxy-5-ureidoimidazoline decarboxylase